MVTATLTHLFHQCLEEPLDPDRKRLFADELEGQGHPELAHPLRESLVQEDPVRLSARGRKLYPPMEWAWKGWLGQDQQVRDEPRSPPWNDFRVAIRLDFSRHQDLPFFSRWTPRPSQVLLGLKDPIQITPFLPSFLSWKWVRDLRHLDLSRSFPGQAGVAKLASSGHFPRLMALEMRDNFLTPNDIKTLAPWLSQSPLQLLDLRGNPALSPPGAQLPGLAGLNRLGTLLLG